MEVLVCGEAVPADEEGILTLAAGLRPFPSRILAGAGGVPGWVC